MKSSCSLLRIIYANSALEIAKKFGRDIINYFFNASDKYKLPLDLMNVALRQASELVRIGSLITTRKDREFVLMRASEILVNIGLWNDKEDVDYDINSLRGWSKKAVINNNLGYINKNLKLS